MILELFVEMLPGSMYCDVLFGNEIVVKFLHSIPGHYSLFNFCSDAHKLFITFCLTIQTSTIHVIYCIFQVHNIRNRFLEEDTHIKIDFRGCTQTLANNYIFYLKNTNIKTFTLNVRYALFREFYAQFVFELDIKRRTLDYLCFVRNVLFL